MTLKKLTVDKIVKYVVENNHSHVSNEIDVRKKNVSNNKLSQKNENFI